jgi:hypothetical protein
MAVTTVTSGLNQTKGIPYTVITDSSADWASVSNDTYFYDLGDGLPHYKDSNGTVLEVFGGGDTSVVSINGKKASAGTIAKGLPVYLVGFDADIHTVEVANANSASTMPVIGFTAEPFNTTDGKEIITYGKLEGIDTTSTVSTLNPNGETWAVNDALYMSTTAGGLTKVRPTGATTQIQRIAKVLKVDATGGQIFVFNTARTAGLPNLGTDKLWIGDANGIPQEVDKSSIGGDTIFTGGTFTGNSTVDLDGNDLTISTLSGSTTPINYEFGTAFGGYYSRWDNNGGLTIKSGTASSAFRVLSKVNAAETMFRVGNEGGGFLSTNGARLWTISDSTTSTTKNEFDENRFSQYWSGSEYHRIQTSGGGTGVSFFRSGISGSLGYFIVGNSSRVGSEEISLQGRTAIKGANTLSTSTAFEIYDGDTTPSKWLEAKNDASLVITKTDSVNSGFALDIDLTSVQSGAGGFNLTGGATSSFLFNINSSNGNVMKSYKYSGNDGVLIGNGAGFDVRPLSVRGGNVGANALGSGRYVNAQFALGGDGIELGFNSTNGGGLIWAKGKAIEIEATTVGIGYQSNQQNAKLHVNGDMIINGATKIGSEDISLQGTTLIDGTLDMNNNRITNTIVNPTVQETTSAATFTINATNENTGVLTAQAVALTVANPTGTIVQGQKLVYRIKDNGTARAITWGANFRAIGVTLPTTTTANKLLYVGCIYNTTDSKWDVIAVNEEA